MEASKIRHLPNEEELVQTLIRSLDGIYYKTLYFAGIQSFDSLIRIGKELEYGIQSGRIVDEQIHFQVLKNPSGERSKNLSTALPLKPNNQNTRQVHAIFDSSGMRFKPYSPHVHATLLDLLEVRKLSHESYEEYIIRWRMEASRICHLPNEEELVQTLIRSLDGIYYKTMYFAGIQSFDSLIRIGKELEYGIQSGRIVDEQIHFQVLKNPLGERSKNLSTSLPLKPNNQNTRQVHDIFDSSGMRFKPYSPQVSQLKVRKPRTFTPLMETLTSIFQRLWIKGLLKPRGGWIPKHSSSTLDLSKSCAYHSNIQGHDTEECPALKNKIQNMIEKGKIIVQQGPLNNSCNPSRSNAVIVQRDPTGIYLRHLTRKHKSRQRN
ncbi:hypothetical protein KY284_026421 [Solanum tuberosum]|nr:hypothetical protein KY284_026421 [Solanum tuberosum]